jgi:hypothetical protein
MVETGSGQLPDAGDHERAFSDNTGCWTNELGELTAYLDGLV